METDLKPLIPLLGSKSLDSLPTREQRFRIRLFRFDFDITHVRGKQLVAADALLRQLLSESTDKLLEGEVKQYVCVFCCPFQIRVPVYNKSFICNMKTVCSRVKEFVALESWPDHLKGDFQAYWNLRDELHIQEALLLRGSRIIVPLSMR